MTAVPLASTRPLPGVVIDARIWIVLSWAGVAAFALTLGVLLLEGRWYELRIAACFFLPLVALLLTPHGLPSLLMALASAAFFLSAAGWAFDWYGGYWWFDVVLHTVNPLLIVTGVMFMLWKAELLAHAPRKGRFILWATGIGLLLGVGWELFEYTYLPLTWPDTILDVVMNTAGAAVGGWFAIWLIDRRGLPPEGHRRLDALRTRALARRVPIPVRTRPRG